jgi:hypothetical protein
LARSDAALHTHIHRRSVPANLERRAGIRPNSARREQIAVNAASGVITLEDVAGHFAHEMGADVDIETD